MDTIASGQGIAVLVRRSVSDVIGSRSQIVTGMVDHGAGILEKCLNALGNKEQLRKSYLTWIWGLIDVVMHGNS